MHTHTYILHVTSLSLYKDPTLTPRNILDALHGIPLWLSDDSNRCLDIPESLHDEIAGNFDEEKAKSELIKEWRNNHPCPAWEDVRELLWLLEQWGTGRNGAAKEVEGKYIKGELFLSIYTTTVCDGFDRKYNLVFHYIMCI